MRTVEDPHEKHNRQCRCRKATSRRLSCCTCHTTHMPQYANVKNIPERISLFMILLNILVQYDDEWGLLCQQIRQSYATVFNITDSDTSIRLDTGSAQTKPVLPWFIFAEFRKYSENKRLNPTEIPQCKRLPRPKIPFRILHCAEVVTILCKNAVTTELKRSASS